MPRRTKVHKCVDKLEKGGMAAGKAIPICQRATHQSFATGKTRTKEGKPVGGPKKARKKKG